ncbi:MAG: asparagine synthase C-terminal domain-containing protein [Cyanobacteriota/Melainabacteria group bacterium]
MDSSLITALASRHVSHTKTFSIGFADRSFDESDHARTEVEAIGTDHSVLRFDPEIACATMQELWQYLDEPIADASIVPTFLLSRMTKKSVTVALSGEGGDELFGGYPTYYAHRLATYWNMIPTPA